MYASFWWQPNISVLKGWTWDVLPKRLVGSEKERRQEEALESLRYFTGQDFGYDVEAWLTFLKAHPNIIEEREASGELPPMEDGLYSL